jgi:hypothetical protein
MASMPHPCLTFCPYLALHDVIDVGEWRLGRFSAFDDSAWADPKLKERAGAFLAKFVDNVGQPMERPTLLCRRNGQIDGQPPTAHEIEALETAIGFAFLDGNPRHTESTRQDSAAVLTADNTELYVWPIDLESGYVTVVTGLMVRTTWGGYSINDPELVIRPPLDLHMPSGCHTADRACLDAVYRATMLALQSPGSNLQADRLHAAVGWFIKAWRNTSTVHFPERVVFLKTAFEALTGTSKSHESARILRHLFEALPEAEPEDSERLLWSPAEKPTHTRSYTKNGKVLTDQITDLERWFMAFAEARNDIIHQGIVPPLHYSSVNPQYDGHYVFTAEFLLRAAVKVSLAPFGYSDWWQSGILRTIRDACRELENL